MNGKPLSSRDWFGKSSAGLILGFLLALGAAGLLKLALGVGDTFFSTQGQLAMWMMSPVWTLTLSFCFLFRSSLRAWSWLALLNIFVWGALALFGGLAA